MNMLKLLPMPNLQAIGGAISKHSPEILTVIGVSGMVASTVFAVKSTPKAIELLEERKKEIKAETSCKDEPKLSVRDIVKTTWRLYLPSALLCVTSIGCIAFASRTNFKRNAALAAAYSISENNFKSYKNKVIETIGEKKEQKVRDDIDSDKIKNNPVSNREVLITPKGTTLCYDSISGRYFRSDIDAIKRAENYLNKNLRDEMYISLNEFYSELGLPQISIGDDIGWNIDYGYLDIGFSSQLADDGSPALVVNYDVTPRYDYRTLM